MVYVSPNKENLEKENIKFGIFSQVLTVILLITLVPLSGLFLMTRDRQESLVENLENDFQSDSELIAARVDSWVDTNILALRQNASVNGMISMDPKAQIPILEASLQTYDWSYLYLTLDINGNNIARSDGGQPKNYKDRAYFLDVVQNNQLVGQQVLISRTNGLPALCLSVPIRQTIQLRGVLVGCATLSEISDTVVNTRIGRTGFAFLVDDAGRLIAHGNRQRMATEALEDFSAHPALAADTVEKQIFYEDDGRAVTAYVQPVSLGWKLVIQQDADEAFIVVKQTRKEAILLVVLTFTSTIVLAYLFAQRLSAPIKSLTQIADDVSRGQLDATIQGIDRSDEIGALARAVKRLAASVKVAFEVLKNK